MSEETRIHDLAVSSGFGLLRTRLRNALLLEGLYTRDKVRAAVESGFILKIGEVGHKSVVELREWLGMPPMPLEGKSPQRMTSREYVNHLVSRYRRKEAGLNRVATLAYQKGYRDGKRAGQGL